MPAVVNVSGAINTANLTITGSSIDTPVVTTGANVTLSETYAGKIIVFNNVTNAVTVTVGSVTTAGFSTTIIRAGTNIVTIANTGATINKKQAANTLSTTYSSATIVYTGANSAIAIGDFT